MARSADGRALTERHRQGQMQIRAAALRDYTKLWPIWRGDDQSFDTLVVATVPLVTAHRQTSIAYSSAYYSAFRMLEAAPGSAAPRVAGAPNVAKLEAALHVTGRIAVRKALQAGFSPQAAMQTALVRTSGAVGTNVLDGGRETLTQSAEADTHARGWQRVAAGNACAFCALLAARGVAYSQEGAGFEAHDHCTCSAEPVYDGSEMPPSSTQFRELYDEAVRDAADGGELARGTTNDALNAFRRALSTRA